MKKKGKRENFLESRLRDGLVTNQYDNEEWRLSDPIYNKDRVG